jgi:hypothetical protein
MSKVQLNWTNPTTRIDGSALPSAQIANIQIYDDASPTPNTPIGTAPGGTATGTFTTGDLAAGVHNFTAVVVDTDGNKSMPSNIYTATITEAAPSPILDLAGSIVP